MQPIAELGHDASCGGIAPAPRGGAMSWFVTLVRVLRIGSVRYVAFYFVAFYAALLARQDGRWSPFWLVVGFAFGLVNCLGIELTNRYADRREDEVNQPERTRLCHAVGYRRIAVLTAAIYGLSVPLCAAWYLSEPNLPLLVMQAVSVFVGLNYSVGLRFKQYRVGALIVLCCTVVLPFLLGWTLRHGELEAIPLGMLCMPLFVVSLAGLKDITDERGDELVGYRSFFLELVRGRRARLLTLLLGAPYFLATALVAAGVAPPRLLALWLLAPGSLALAVLARGARPGREAFVVRELMYDLWLVFLSALLWLLFPYRAMIPLLASAALYWGLATRFLHWHRGLERSDASLLLALFQRATGRDGRAGTTTTAFADRSAVVEEDR